MYLGIDFGKKRIGLAVGEVLPRGIGILDGSKPIDVIASEIGKICEQHDVEALVIGLPVFDDGSEGEMAKKVRIFGNAINEKLKIPVIYEEETYTSVEAEDFLKRYDKNYDSKSGEIDELAAVLILEQFLNHQTKSK